MQKGAGKYNVVVIGGGTAGLVTAVGTAGLGGRVALVERARLGGDCLNVGCVPSKALISSARLAQNIREANRWGLDPHEPPFAFERVFERMRARRAEIAPNDSRERMESLGIDVFQADARFLSPHEVQVGDTRLRAQNFVVATGSRPAIPPIPGLSEVPYHTNETIFDDLRTKPASLLILGGGPIACELGQTFQRLGVPTTILQKGSRLLPNEDADAADLLEQTLLRDGVKVHKNADTVSAARHADGLTLTLADGTTHTAAALLVATGRRPRVENLGLDAAGVATDAHGVRVNQYLQTTQPHVYAAGDVAGPYAFTHLAEYHARIVVRNLLVPFDILRQKPDYRVLPWCTYTDPEVARVGLNEDEARHQNTAYDLYTFDLSKVDRAVVESEETGFVKVLTARGTDNILGVTLVGAHAGDLLQEFVLAMKYKLGLSQVGAAIHPYPTFALVARQVAGQYDKTRLSPRLKKVFAWLYHRQLR